MNTSQHLSDDLLNAWVDGSATDGEQSIIQEHLSHCAPCRKELNDLNAVKRALSALPQPAPPRTFQLTAEQARRPATIPADPVPSKHMQLLPIVRVLSIAAVITFLVLGGSLALGPVAGALRDDSVQTAQITETDESAGASQNQNQDSPMAAFPGDVVDQGDAASSTSSMTDSLGEQPSNANTGAMDASEGDNGLSLLELATMTAAILAGTFLGLWVLLGRMSQPHAAHQTIDRS